MNTVANEPTLPNEYSNKNLQKKSFRGKDLSYANFSGSDLRGADFSGTNLTYADLSRTKTGIPPAETIIIFFIALVISLLSGYVAMLSGRTMQAMINSSESRIQVAGWIAAISILLFIIYSIWKGLGKAVRYLIIPICIIAILFGTTVYVTGVGEGKGSFFIVLSFFLTVVMFIIGTIARAVAGELSNILFMIVALGGGIFGKNIGGGIETVVMAISCAVISKRALAGVKGFESFKKISSFATKRFGTSFRNSKLANANFSQSKIKNADFTNADISTVNWNDSKKFSCINAMSEKTIDVK